MQARDADQPQNLDALDNAAPGRRARRGNGDAPRIIVRRNNQRRSRAARPVVQDYSEAEDVVQQARAFASARSFRSDAGSATWLVRILNEALGCPR